MFPPRVIYWSCWRKLFFAWPFSREVKGQGQLQDSKLGAGRISPGAPVKDQSLTTRQTTNVFCSVTLIWYVVCLSKMLKRNLYFLYILFLFCVSRELQCISFASSWWILATSAVHFAAVIWLEHLFHAPTVGKDQCNLMLYKLLSNCFAVWGFDSRIRNVGDATGSGKILEHDSSALVLYCNEQVWVNLLGKFHLWFVTMRAAENYSISITSQAHYHK